MSDHIWVPSKFGHGESMCKHCFVTNREAAVLGILGKCNAPLSKHSLPTAKDKIIEVMARAMCLDLGEDTDALNVLIRDRPGTRPHWEGYESTAEAALSALHAKGLAVVQGWQPIEAAPTDRLILVYCPSYQGLNAIVCCCQWDEDAGFCVDELRSPSHWMPLPAPPTNSTKEESDE